jgi:hypothetical protein
MDRKKLNLIINSSIENNENEIVEEEQIDIDCSSVTVDSDNLGKMNY